MTIFGNVIIKGIKIVIMVTERNRQKEKEKPRHMATAREDVLNWIKCFWMPKELKN